MANPEHLEILKSGRDAFNKWRDEHPDVRIDLSGANLAKMNLAYYDLDYANLRLTNMREVSLRGARLRRASMQEAVLRQADMRGSKLWQAVLRGADLRRAMLREADIREAELRGCNLADADLSSTSLVGADLRRSNLWRAVLEDALLVKAKLLGANLIVGAQDVRGHQSLLTYDRDSGKIDIQFGCQRWHSFDDAGAHFGPDYRSFGNPEECRLILDNLDARYRLRMRQEANQRPLAIWGPTPTTDNKEAHP